MSEKSKGPSTTSPLFELLESKTAIFLDRDQGNKIMPEILRKAGLNVECHSSHFAHDIKDEVWIPAVTKKGWIIVTSDQKIETDPLSRLAVIESRAKVFVLEENNSRAPYWAAAILVSRERMYELCHDSDGPFFINLHRKTGSLLWKYRVPRLEDSEAEAHSKSA